MNCLGSPRLAGAECGSRGSQVDLNPFCLRVRAAKHAPRGSFNVHKRFHGLAELVERGAVAFVKCHRVNPPTYLLGDEVPAVEKPTCVEYTAKDLAKIDYDVVCQRKYSNGCTWPNKELPQAGRYCDPVLIQAGCKH